MSHLKVVIRIFTPVWIGWTTYIYVPCTDKNTIVPLQAMKAYRGRRGIAALILHVDIDGRECLFYDPAALPLGKKTVPVD